MKPRHKNGKLTLARIYANCKPKGGCKLWNGGVTRSCLPSVYDPAYRVSGRPGGGTRSGRVVVWVLKHGEKPAAGLKIAMTCGNALCLEHRCMRLMTPPEIGALAAERGSFKTLRAHVAQIANSRRGAKLSPSKAHDIRLRLRAGDCPDAVAADYAVQRRHVLDIGAGKLWKEHAMPNSSVFNMAAAT